MAAGSWGSEPKCYVCDYETRQGQRLMGKGEDFPTRGLIEVARDLCVFPSLPLEVLACPAEVAGVSSQASECFARYNNDSPVPGQAVPTGKVSALRLERGSLHQEMSWGSFRS